MGLFEKGPELFGGREREQTPKSKQEPEKKLKPEGASSPEEIALHERISQMSAEELNAEKQKLSEREKKLSVVGQEIAEKFPGKVPEDVRKLWLEKELQFLRIGKSIGRREQQLLDKQSHGALEDLLGKIKEI